MQALRNRISRVTATRAFEHHHFSGAASKNEGGSIPAGPAPNIHLTCACRRGFNPAFTHYPSPCALPVRRVFCRDVPEREGTLYPSDSIRRNAMKADRADATSLQSHPPRSVAMFFDRQTWCEQGRLYQISEFYRRSTLITQIGPRIPPTNRSMPGNPRLIMFEPQWPATT